MHDRMDGMIRIAKQLESKATTHTVIRPVVKQQLHCLPNTTTPPSNFLLNLKQREREREEQREREKKEKLIAIIQQL